MSRVSVIIPSFNREALIGETLRNVLAQTLPPHEVIVVDDGSTDRSVEVISSFGAKVKLIRQPNQGPGAARNAGLWEATGDFIQFQDSDDLFSRNKLEAQARLMEENRADIVFSPWVKMRLDGKQAVPENHVLQQAMPSDALPLSHWWLRGWSTVFQSLLFRRSFLDRVGGYRTDLIIGEDGELFFRALTSAPKVAFTGEALTLYRLHDTNKLTQDQGTSRARRIIDWAQALRGMIERADQCGLALDRGSRLQLTAEIAKQLRYLQALSEAPADLLEMLSRRAREYPAWRLQLAETKARVIARARQQLLGSRWMPAYRAAPLTAAQRNLIRDIGFETD